MSRAALLDDGLFCFLVLLTLLLVMSVDAAIRTPPEFISPPPQAPPAPARPRLQATTRSASAAARSGAGYVAKHAAPVPRQDLIQLPKVFGKPPWGPAAKPPA